MAAAPSDRALLIDYNDKGRAGGFMDEMDDDDADEDSDDGDVSRREKQARQELEELDRQYFIGDADNIDATDGFFNKGNYGYGHKKH